MKVLLVEDDLSISELLSATLTVHRYTVDVAHDGQTGLELAQLWAYDVILLDVQLPKMDGITVCRQLRAQGDRTPILILTARDSNNDIVTGLDAGADDYVTKPCDPSQLLARIRALLRRGGVATPSPLLTWGDLCLDPALVQVTYKQKLLSLRPQEYNLLELFLRHPQRVFSRSAILDHLWTAEDFPTENAVTNLIKDLRRKLKSAGITEDIIETIYGLGYRLKTLTTAVLEAGDLPLDQKPIEQTDGLALIHQLTERFHSSLNDRVTFLQDVVRSLPSGNEEPSRRQEAEQEAHRLAGALGTYGYDQGSQLARLIELELSNADAIDTAKAAQLLDWLRSLQQAVMDPPSLAIHLEEQSTSQHPLVLVVAQDTTVAEELWREAPAWGLRVEITSARLAALAQCQEETPAIIVIDLEGATADHQGLEVLRAFKEQFPSVPVLTLAEQNSLTNRIAASRLGSERYLLKPVTTGQVLEAIAQFCLVSPTTDAQVLAVDDDPFMLAQLTHLLQPWGLHVTGLTESDRFWEVLTQLEPDLLILDLEMPPFNGIELCRIVRQDAKYGDLPILVVTAHTELEYIQQVFEAGADDLIRKPIAGPELVTRVISRIERSRLRQQLDQLRHHTRSLQQQSRIDALTQIANRRQFDEFLEREWQCHSHQQAPLSLILCDIDCFKLYNDHYGHLAGDRCLKQIANAIQTCIKPLKDLVARYEGGEFGIILPNTSLNGALQVAGYIRQAIADLQIPHSESSAHSTTVTVSIGIAGTLPIPEKPPEDLVKAADEALYAAKRRGRNTYCLYLM